jgi:hypothetical protein
MILLGGYLKNYEMIFQSAKFYGAANLILNQNLDYIYLSASWSHGADDIFHSYHSALSHIHPQEFNLSRHLVTNENIKKYPGMNAYEVYAVGSPFVYTNPNIKENHGTKFRRAYMPIHSLKGISFRSDYQSWLETAIVNKCDSIILANSDFEPFKKTLRAIIPSDIKIIRGAKVDEPNTLERLKNLFYSVKECVFDTPGSQIIYAIICGVIPIFIENKKSNSERHIILTKLANQYPKNIRSDIEKHMFSRISDNQLYTAWSKYSKKELIELSEFSSGMHCKKNKNYISKLLLPKTRKENISNFTTLLKSKIKYKVLNY